MGSKKAATLSVYFTNDLAYNYAYSPDDVTSSYDVQSGGSVVASGLTPYTWLLGGVNSDYALKAELNTGTVSTGTIGAWNALSASQGWSKTRTTNTIGVSRVILDMQVRRVSDSVVIATFQVTIEAEVV